ncbi:MAG TPA: hypothetical protein VN873_18065 [Candidatus Angelobacter sp.]|nr:hypothetical protein [Candidatus Angelobacter sp.]
MNGFEADGWRPGLDARAAPGGFNEADGDVQVGVNFAAEEITGGGKLGGFERVRIAGAPGAELFEIVERRGGKLFFHFEEPDVRVVAGGEFFRGIEAGLLAGLVADGFFHVRLAGAKPDFADQNVGERFGFAGLNDERLREESGVEFFELHEPAALFVGVGGGGLAVEIYRDLRAGRGPTPNRHGLLLLENHVITENGGQFERA